MKTARPPIPSTEAERRVRQLSPSTLSSRAQF